VTAEIILPLVAVASAAGAVSRYLIGQWVQRIVGEHNPLALPWGTMTINITGTFLLGFLTGIAMNHGLPAEVLTVAGTGFCGGYTTFSTFAHETIRLLEDGSPTVATMNVAASLIAGLAAGGAGLGLASL
jgi:CrcB protein